MSEMIQHRATVKEITQGTYRVEYLADMSCSSCVAKGFCAAGAGEERSVTVEDAPGKYRAGEEVKLIISQKTGYKALFFGYVFPFIIVFISLIILSNLFNELAAGLLSILTLGPYFLILFIYRKKLQNTFKLSLEKL